MSTSNTKSEKLERILIKEKKQDVGTIWKKLPDEVKIYVFDQILEKGYADLGMCVLVLSSNCMRTFFHCSPRCDNSCHNLSNFCVPRPGGVWTETMNSSTRFTLSTSPVIFLSIPLHLTGIICIIYTQERKPHRTILIQRESDSTH